ncbi:hypothetical protein L3X38_028465 [Prunus dulcis]|uniref:Uncharacterized protein n=1 Tax=Prunus dulcis TaxID=3755 RepID=A0AAD4VR68_PRUDU|nr:hypothetical protein L3X38_028465 [Prunus dulcis]
MTLLPSLRHIIYLVERYSNGNANSPISLLSLRHINMLRNRSKMHTTSSNFHPKKKCQSNPHPNPNLRFPGRWFLSLLYMIFLSSHLRMIDCHNDAIKTSLLRFIYCCN